MRFYDWLTQAVLRRPVELTQTSREAPGPTLDLGVTGLGSLSRDGRPRVGRRGLLPKSVGFDRCPDAAHLTGQTVGSPRG